MIDRGKLYLVPTPIGNLDDLTKRAGKILSEVDLIACEDTRHTGQLLKRLDIKKKLLSYHEHNEAARARQLIETILKGANVAIVSDAGSPGISDPGYRVIKAAVDNNIEIVPLPGANSIIPALTASGLPTDRFFFEGFLSHKSAARRKRIGQLSELPHTLVFFESPFRLVKCLTDMKQSLGDRPACVVREISKIHEEFVRGTLTEVIEKFSGRTVKGEIVIVVAGSHNTKE